MSTWDVRFNRRTQTIVIEEVLRRYQDHAAGLPGMEIRDQEGKEHTVCYIDLSGITPAEWKKLGPGSVISLTFMEKIARVDVLDPEKKQKKSLLHDATSSYFWSCGTCCRRGEVKFFDGDDPKVIANKIYEAHLVACMESNLVKCSPEYLHVMNEKMERQLQLEDLVKMERSATV